LLIDLKGGQVIWQRPYEFIHDLAFNQDGSYLAIFVRPLGTNTGYVNVLNVARLEWVCRVKLEYGVQPLGWDAFAWCGDSLVFIAPYTMSVLTAEELTALEKKTPVSQKKEVKKIVGLDEQVTTAESQTTAQEPIQASNSIIEKVSTNEENLKKLMIEIKKREICVLGIGKRWWDCEKPTLDALTNLTESESASKLILEYAGLSWGILQFGFPPMESGLSGAMTEVLKSGYVDNELYLLLSKMDRDPKTKSLVNQWIFYVTQIPSSFYHMWKAVRNNSSSLGKSVRVGVLGSQDREIPDIFQIV